MAARSDGGARGHRRMEIRGGRGASRSLASVITHQSPPLVIACAAREKRAASSTPWSATCSRWRTRRLRRLTSYLMDLDA